MIRDEESFPLHLSPEEGGGESWAEANLMIWSAGRLGLKRYLFIIQTFHVLIYFEHLPPPKPVSFHALNLFSIPIHLSIHDKPGAD